MANCLYATYFLIDDDKLSEYQNFDDSKKNLDHEPEYLSVQSGYGYSAWILSEFLQASGREGELKFLTEVRNPNDFSYTLITSDLFEKNYIRNQ